jgi:hypothetical protein
MRLVQATSRQIASGMIRLWMSMTDEAKRRAANTPPLIQKSISGSPVVVEHVFYLGRNGGKDGVTEQGVQARKQQGCQNYADEDSDPYVERRLAFFVNKDSADGTGRFDRAEPCPLKYSFHSVYLQMFLLWMD